MAVKKTTKKAPRKAPAKKVAKKPAGKKFLVTTDAAGNIKTMKPVK